nr:MAG: coat protein [Flammulina alphapartitivirus 2]
MSLNEDQVRALASLAEALKGTTIEELIKSNIGQSETQKQSSSALQDLADTTTETTGLKALLAMHAGITLTRDANTQGSYFTPTMAKIMHTLNIMDYHISNNFQARRSMPHFFPTVSRLYISIIILIQILRVQRHNRSIQQSDLAFVEDLLECYPPETLPIPGPLIPFFKSLCTSFPENSNLRRVSPALPKKYPLLPTSATDPTLMAHSIASRFIDNNHIDFMIPFPPYIAILHHALIDTHPGTLTLGNDDSANTGNKTVTSTPDVAYPNIVDLLKHPKKSIRQEYFPFAITARAATAPNATTNPLTMATRTMFGSTINGPFSGFSTTEKWNTQKLGLSEPIRINVDLIDQFKRNFAMLDIPSPDASETIETLAEALLMDQDMQWFGKVAAIMSIYSKFFAESGSLADCSLEGPRIAQIVTVLEPPTTLPSVPTYFADPKSQYGYDLRLKSSISKTEPIIEMTSAYTCINSQMFATHPRFGTLGTTSRTGLFWDTRPEYTNSSLDKGWLKTDQVIQNEVIARPALTKSS